MGKKGYTDDYDYPSNEKPTAVTAGFRRFLILLVLLILGGVLFFGMMTNPAPTIPETQPTPNSGGVNVSVQQDAPSVNVSVQQDAPPPLPPPPDNAPAIMAQQTALDARARADIAQSTALALAPRVDALESNQARLEAGQARLATDLESSQASQANAPDLLPTIAHLQHIHGQTVTQLATLQTGLLGAFLGLALLVFAVAWLAFAPAKMHPPTPNNEHLTIAQNDPPRLSHPMHRANTVLHGASTVQSTAGANLVISDTKPTITKKATELTEWERRYIQNTYNRLGTYTAVSNQIWGYHNKVTLGCVKSVVG